MTFDIIVQHYEGQIDGFLKKDAYFGRKIDIWPPVVPM